MKKIVYLLLITAIFLIAAVSAQGHSEWAKYRTQPVPDDVKVPSKFIDPVTNTIDCCGCHWNTNHAGPGTGFCD